MKVFVPMLTPNGFDGLYHQAEVSAATQNALSQIRTANCADAARNRNCLWFGKSKPLRSYQGARPADGQREGVRMRPITCSSTGRAA